MAKVIIMPQKIEERYCHWRHEYVPTDLKRSKNGSENHVCLDAANCKKYRLCDAIKLPSNKVKLNYVKCCGVCQRFGYCKHRRKTAKVGEPAFVKSKERED